MSFWNNQKVLVTGSRGLLGLPLCEQLRSLGAEVIAPTHKFLDLCNLSDVERLFEFVKFDCVFHLAAKVGGVKANMEQMADFYIENSMMNNNLFYAANTAGVNRIISVLSTCVYPDEKYVTYPLTEEQLHNGLGHVSNFGYSFAKRNLDVLSRAYRQQYKRDYITAIPNNLAGPNDNFDLNDAHVIPALMRKIHEAKMNNESSVEIWGDGSPLREFTYSKDAAKILVLLAEHYHGEHPVNIGNTQEYSIKQVAEKLKEIIEFKGELVYNTEKPLGQYRKPSTNKKLLDMGFWGESDYTPLEIGLRETYGWFLSRWPNIRGVKYNVYPR